MPVETDELVADMRRVAREIEKNALTYRDYDSHGRYASQTVLRRFGSWNKALLAAGIETSNDLNIADEQLFENMLTLWQHYGRQPRRSELTSLPSTFSQGPYNRRFGSWTAALEAFVNYANGTGVESPLAGAETARRRTGQAPSLRLRWHVLQRDRFTCCACGASPALTAGVELHVDHVVPWSKNGETVLENLQTLCSICNLGKSNVHTG
jgi:hypothetical protein